MNLRIVTLLCGVLGCVPVMVEAEPYLAVREGMDCAVCHTNPTGGGQRNVFGNTYAQQQLAARQDMGPGSTPWLGQVAEVLTFGGNARVAASQVDADRQDGTLDFGVQRVTLYGGISVNKFVNLYIDQQVAPGGSLNREAWIQLTRDNFYLKAGRMFVPFGWRLEDNASLVRQATAINMLQGDDGVEIGYRKNKFVAQVTVTNGAGGGAERDDGKQFSTRLALVDEAWQAGISAAHNNTDVADRSMYGMFAGFNTGPVSWLLEYDLIDDSQDSSSPVNPRLNLEQDAALLEANWLLRKGHNVKATFEHLSFDDRTEDQNRSSLVYEYVPYPFVQLRTGYRKRDSDDLNPFLSSDEGFVEIHAFF